MYQVIVFMHGYYSGKLPDIFKKLFVKNYEVHLYHTRQSKQLHVLKANTTLYKNSIKFVGVSFWNYIVNRLPCDCKPITFKNKLKFYLLNNEITHIIKNS